MWPPHTSTSSKRCRARSRSHWLRQTGLQDVVLAGGVAANVKLNQRIADLEGVRRIFIYPNMGDGGTDVGAVLAFLCARGEVGVEGVGDLLPGPRFQRRADGGGDTCGGTRSPTRSENVARDVAKLLADGNVVARFAGAMEYGPRALGNRSILYAATDSERQRVAEPPPRPHGVHAVRAGDARRALSRAVSRRRQALIAPARFMTITCECTELMKRESPAAVHVDGTARPQVIRREDNPDFYAIVEEYHGLTGDPDLDQHLLQHARGADRLHARGRRARVPGREPRLPLDGPVPRRVGIAERVQVAARLAPRRGMSDARDRKPSFLISIDTEGDDLWSFRRR